MSRPSGPHPEPEPSPARTGAPAPSRLGVGDRSGGAVAERVA